MARIFGALIVAAITTSATASAQTRYVTAEITGGTLNVALSGAGLTASFDLTGPGFHFVSDGIEPGVVSAATTCTSPGCRPGEVFTLDADFTGSFLGHGFAAVGGETLNPAYFAGRLVIVTDELTIPKGNRKHLVLSVPFTLAASPTEPGATLGAWPTTLKDSAPWVSASLTGGGTATAFFERVHYKKGSNLPERFYYVLVRVIYSFIPSGTTLSLATS